MAEILLLPFLACLVLAAIHVYLGLHVLARGVIFVDLALAQVAALGLTVAILAGHAPASVEAYGYALAFAIGGALLLAWTRQREERVPQEAIIGIVYAVSAALAIRSLLGESEDHAAPFHLAIHVAGAPPAFPKNPPT